MDIWFKAKVDWGEALGLLSDTEAGRFAKALWKYAATGEAGTLTGREQMLFALDDGLWEADARAELDDVAQLVDPRLAEEVVVFAHQPMGPTADRAVRHKIAQADRDRGKRGPAQNPASFGPRR